MKEFINRNETEILILTLTIAFLAFVSIMFYSNDKKTERITYIKSEAFKSCVVNNNPAECALAVEGLR